MNYLTEMTTLAPKIVQGQTNVIKYNIVIFTSHKPLHPLISPFWAYYTGEAPLKFDNLQGLIFRL